MMLRFTLTFKDSHHTDTYFRDALAGLNVDMRRIDEHGREFIVLESTDHRFLEHVPSGGKLEVEAA